MLKDKNGRTFAFWLAVAVAITAASMSASKHHKAEQPVAAASYATPHVTLTLPLN